MLKEEFGIKAVIFDLNGVVIKSPKFSDIFCAKFDLSTEKFLPVLKEIMAKVRMPNAGNAFSYLEPYLKKWKVNLSQEEFFDFWFNSEKEDTKMTDLMKKLKQQGIKVFVLSNNFAERTKYYDEHFPFLKGIADKIYYSWQTGFVKPNPEAYKLILSENNLKPEECIYFDDSEENIKTTTSLGIKSFIFEGVAKTKSILKKYIKFDEASELAAQDKT